MATTKQVLNLSFYPHVQHTPPCLVYYMLFKLCSKGWHLLFPCEIFHGSDYDDTWVSIWQTLNSIGPSPLKATAQYI